MWLVCTFKHEDPKTFKAYIELGIFDQMMNDMMDDFCTTPDIDQYIDIHAKTQCHKKCMRTKVAYIINASMKDVSTVILHCDSTLQNKR